MTFRPNRLLEVQTPPIADDFEGQCTDWQTVRTEWFELKPLSASQRLRGDEREQAVQMQSTTTHAAHCYWFPGSTSRMRLRDAGRGRIYNVGSVVNVDEQSRKLQWRLTEVEVESAT